MTIWRRLEIEEAKLNDVIDIVTKEMFPNAIYAELVDKYGDDNIRDEILEDTEGFLYPEDNDNQDTIEIYDEEHNMVWNNVTFLKQA